ncbi:unnamed protein product [Musa acuminata var. zebrina]
MSDYITKVKQLLEATVVAAYATLSHLALCSTIEVFTRATKLWMGTSVLRSASVIIIRATKTLNVLGTDLQSIFNFLENGVELYVEKVNNRELCAIAQAVFPVQASHGELIVRHFVCVSVMCFVMESGAKGCKVSFFYHFIQRTCQINGNPIDEYIGSVVRHVLLRIVGFCNHGMIKSSDLGVLDIKVKIMLDWDPKGKQGLMTPLLDHVTIHAP